MGGKGHAFFFDFSQRRQAEHLKSTGVCENRAIPGHEFVQAAHLTHHLVGGTQMQVVGIGQLHLTTNIFQILGTEPTFDGGLRAYIHKHRRLYRAMCTGKFTTPGIAFGFF